MNCPKCFGEGKVPKMTFPFMWLPKKCDRCNGTGEITNDNRGRGCLDKKDVVSEPK